MLLLVVNLTELSFFIFEEDKRGEGRRHSNLQIKKKI